MISPPENLILRRLPANPIEKNAPANINTCTVGVALVDPTDTIRGVSAKAVRGEYLLDTEATFSVAGKRSIYAYESRAIRIRGAVNLESIQVEALPLAAPQARLADTSRRAIGFGETVTGLAPVDEAVAVIVRPVAVVVGWSHLTYAGTKLTTRTGLGPSMTEADPFRPCRAGVAGGGEIVVDVNAPRLRVAGVVGAGVVVIADDRGMGAGTLVATIGGAYIGGVLFAIRRRDASARRLTTDKLRVIATTIGSDGFDRTGCWWVSRQEFCALPKPSTLLFETRRPCGTGMSTVAADFCIWIPIGAHGG